MSPCNVLFICTGNSARSILAEATLNALGGNRFAGFSAGSRPAGHVHPRALDVLREAGIATDGLHSKSWDAFAGERASALDIVVTVCDSAATEPCPTLFGDFVRTHWGLPDPAAVAEAAQPEAFRATYRNLRARLRALIDLPLESLPRAQWAERLDAIARLTGETQA